jgi:hypothetical protein
MTTEFGLGCLLVACLSWSWMRFEIGYAAPELSRGSFTSQDKHR